jgi:hypothetical protein
MGRMSGESLRGAGTGSTSAARRPDRASAPFSPSSEAAAGSTSPSAATWPTSSPAWPTALSNPSPNSLLPPTLPTWQSNLPDPPPTRQPCPCPEAYVQSLQIVHCASTVIRRSGPTSAGACRQGAPRVPKKCPLQLHIKRLAGCEVIFIPKPLAIM